MDGERTYSIYELVDASGAKVFTAPAMLSDPKYDPDRQFRNYDRITVPTSASKNTILIIEDRSPAYPQKAFILLRRRPDSSWTWSQFHDVPIFFRFADRGPDFTYFPDVIGLSDTNTWFTAKGRVYRSAGPPSNKVNTWSQPLDAIKPDA